MDIRVRKFMNIYIHVCTMFRHVYTVLPYPVQGGRIPDDDVSPSRGPPPQGDWQVTGIGVRRQHSLAAHGAAGRELHTIAPAVCILERHPTTAILPSYRRTSWV